MNDPFETLGIDPRYSLDLGEIEKRHRELSRTLHPDRYTGRPAGERRMALGRAIEVNEAWRVVRDPIKRAEALLRRAGLTVDEDKTPTVRPELLMDMMEQRELLSDARAKGDLKRVRAMVQELLERNALIETRLGEYLDHAELGPENHTRAMATLAELRFVRRLLDEAGAAEDALT